jgi:hypothetical protein
LEKLTRRSNDGGIHDGAGVDLEASRLQLLADLGKQCFSQLVVIDECANLGDRCGVRQRLSPQVNANEAAQTGAVVQRLLTGQVSEVEPKLNELDTLHALKTDGRTPVACLG